jgi:hypothetical protein
MALNGLKRELELCHEFTAIVTLKAAGDINFRLQTRGIVGTDTWVLLHLSRDFALYLITQRMLLRSSLMPPARYTGVETWTCCSTPLETSRTAI